MIDKKGILYREIYLKDYGIKVSLSLIMLQENSIRKYYVKNFIVNPLSPLEADLLVNGFKQKIVWYYLGENKIFFYPKNIEQFCFSNINDAEKTIISRIVETIYIDIFHEKFIQKIKEFFIKNGWLVHINKELIEGRKTSIIKSKVIITEIKIFQLESPENILEVLVKIYPITHNERIQLLRKIKIYWGNYLISSKMHPHFLLKFLFKELRDWEIIEKIKNLYKLIHGEIGKS